MAKINLFIKLAHGDINGNLCAHEGRLMVILPNYTEVLAGVPEITDTTYAAYRIEVDEDDLRIDMDGGREVIRLWRGGKRGRDNDADKLSLPIASLKPLVGESVKPATPVVQDPPVVQLAAILAVGGAELIDQLPGTGPSRIADTLEWANGVLTVHHGKG